MSISPSFSITRPSLAIFDALSWLTPTLSLVLAASAPLAAVDVVAGNLTLSGAAVVNNSIYLGGDPNGQIELGKTNGVAGTPYIDFHSVAGTANDFDARIICAGGTSGKLATGTLYLQASAVSCANGYLAAGTDLYAGRNMIMGAGGQLYSPGRMHINGEELLYILNKQGMVIGKEWGGNGNLTVEGNLNLAANVVLSSPGRMHINGEELLYILNKQGMVIGKEWGGNGNLTVEGNVNLAAGVVLSAPGRMHINGTELLYILNTQGVVIGKEWGGNGNLSVEGSLHAADITTAHLLVRQNWWGDSVFAADYHLMPLREVKQYVLANKHLPAVPDEATILKNGLQVNDMLATHMMKIEELTLHCIHQEEIMQRQEETIERQEKDLAEQKILNAALLSRLERLEHAIVAPQAQGK